MSRNGWNDGEALRLGAAQPVIVMTAARRMMCLLVLTEPGDKPTKNTATRRRMSGNTQETGSAGATSCRVLSSRLWPVKPIVGVPGTLDRSSSAVPGQRRPFLWTTNGTATATGSLERKMICASRMLWTAAGSAPLPYVSRAIRCNLKVDQRRRPPAAAIALFGVRFVFNRESMSLFPGEAKSCVNL